MNGPSNTGRVNTTVPAPAFPRKKSRRSKRRKVVVTPILSASHNNAVAERVKMPPVRKSPTAQGAVAIKAASAVLNKVQPDRTKRSQPQQNNRQSVQNSPVAKKKSRKSRNRSRKSNIAQKVAIATVASAINAPKVQNVGTDTKTDDTKFSSKYEFVFDNPVLLAALAESVNDETVTAGVRVIKKRSRGHKKAVLSSVALPNKGDNRPTKKQAELVPQRPLKNSPRNKIQQPCTKNNANIAIINDAARNNEIVLFKNEKDTLPVGTYYRTPEGLRSVPANLTSDDGAPIVKNHLCNLAYDGSVCAKMRRDLRHGFSTDVEKLYGDWARVVVKNAINEPGQITENRKKFELCVTMPGCINETKNVGGKKVIQKNTGVFEFTVRKSLYEKKGLCVHRFLAPKGMVGAYEFGAKAQNKRENQ